MSKKIKRLLWMLTAMVVIIPCAETHAAEKSFQSRHNKDLVNNVELNNIDDERLFITEYIVVTTKEPMRKGPGTNYSIVGYLYKDDIVNVSSIKDGWAKFKVNGEWRYIKESSIKKY